MDYLFEFLLCLPQLLSFWFQGSVYQAELVHGPYPQTERPSSHAAVFDNVSTEQRVVVKTSEGIENIIRHASHVVKLKIFEEVFSVEEKLALFPAGGKIKNEIKIKN